MAASAKPPHNSFDIIIIGAGISGINAAYRLQEGLPDMSYAVLEARAGMGGTWDLFKYPGIRSDSDLHTFGFPWVSQVSFDVTTADNFRTRGLRKEQLPMALPL